MKNVFVPLPTAEVNSHRYLRQREALLNRRATSNLANLSETQFLMPSMKKNSVN